MAVKKRHLFQLLLLVSESGLISNFLVEDLKMVLQFYSDYFFMFYNVNK